MSMLFIRYSFTFFHLLNYLIPKLLVWIITQYLSSIYPGLCLSDLYGNSKLKFCSQTFSEWIFQLQKRRLEQPDSGVRNRDAPPESVTQTRPAELHPDQKNQWASVIKWWRCLMGYRTEGPRALCWIQINRSVVAENPEPKILESLYKNII